MWGEIFSNTQSPIPSPQYPVPSPQSPVPSPQSPVPSPQIHQKRLTDVNLLWLNHIRIGTETSMLENTPEVKETLTREDFD